MNLHSTNAAVYNDLAGLAALRHQASHAPDAAAAEVARQFEAIFVNMMLKSMRDATPEGGLFSGHEMSAYRDMFDKQLSLDLAAEGGIGLAPLIERQLAQANALQRGGLAGASGS